MTSSADLASQAAADLASISAAILRMSAERSAEAVLERAAEAARDLAGGRYAAVGVPDGHGGFSRFVTAGLTDAEITAIGPLPRQHGLLGVLLGEPAPYRTADITRDARFQGWPSAHPDMRAFLGVPVVAGAEVIGAIYVTDKLGAVEFTDEDHRRVGLLADHVAVAMDNARLWERSRELVMTEERTWIARELHDGMTQRLFSLNLTAEAAAARLADDPQATAAHLRTIQELAVQTLRELRALIVDLRPADLDADGLAPALSSHVDLLRRAHGLDVKIDAQVDADLSAHTQREVFRVAQEALHNVVRHAQAGHVTVTLTAGDGVLLLRVTDDGRGFDPTEPRLRATRLGLTSMRHRARALGGRLRIDAAPGAGTTVTLEAPLGR